jgi:MFS family permease
MPNFWSFVIVAGAVAVMQLIVMATTNSFVVSTAPPGYLGRIYGIYLMIFWIGATVGAPIVGYFAQHLGIRVAIFTGGAITTLVSTTLFVKKKGV